MDEQYAIIQNGVRMGTFKDETSARQALNKYCEKGFIVPLSKWKKDKLI